MFSIELLSRVDLLTSTVGALICVTFIKNEAFREERDTPFPWEQAIGMIFTTSMCPMAMLYDFSFYEKWRNVLVVILRLSFMVGTLADYGDVPHRVFETWPSFLCTVLLTARCAVICWGGFGWLLPFKYHIWMQGIHAMLAFHLIPETCALPSTSRFANGTFLSLNEDRWRTIATVLDWPLVFLGGATYQGLQNGSSAFATCAAVNMWVIIVVGWMVPSMALSFLYPKLSSRKRALLQRDGMFGMALACTMYWIVLRATTASLF